MDQHDVRSAAAGRKRQPGWRSRRHLRRRARGATGRGDLAARRNDAHEPARDCHSVKDRRRRPPRSATVRPTDSVVSAGALAGAERTARKRARLRKRPVGLSRVLRTVWRFYAWTICAEGVRRVAVEPAVRGGHCAPSAACRRSDRSAFGPVQLDGFQGIEGPSPGIADRSDSDVERECSWSAADRDHTSGSKCGDDSERSACTGGTAVRLAAGDAEIEIAPGLCRSGERPRGDWGTETEPDFRKSRAPVSVGEESVVTQPDKALRKHVEQETPCEFRAAHGSGCRPCCGDGDRGNGSARAHWQTRGCRALLIAMR